MTNKLIPQGSRVLCALSGGIDSVCLLHYLLHCQGYELAAAHLNHGIRGEEAKRDQAFCESLCAAWKVPFFTATLDVPQYAREQKKGLEEAARELRYDFLQQTAQEWKADYIATAHNANDDAETVLMHLCRGSGLKGLGGIAPKRGNIVRPLLDWTRQQIEEYAQAQQLPHVEDSTNEELQYTRNRVRKEVLPLLEEIHPGAKESIHRTATLLREDEDFLQQTAVEAFARQSSDGLSVKDLQALHPAVAKRVIRLWLGNGLTQEHVNAVLALCQESSGTETDVAFYKIRREFDFLKKISRRAVIASQKINPGDVIDFPSLGYRLSCSEAVFSEGLKISFTQFCLAKEALQGPLQLTSRREGDAICLWKRQTKSLQDLFIEEKIPLSQREQIPVLRDELGPVAIPKLGQALRCMPQAGQPVYVIQIQKIPERNDT